MKIMFSLKMDTTVTPDPRSVKARCRRFSVQRASTAKSSGRFRSTRTLGAPMAPADPVPLAAVAQRGRQPAHREQDAALDEFVVVSGSVATQQLHLQGVQRLEIREPVEYRSRERRVVGDQVILTGDQLVHPDRAGVLGDDLVEHTPPQFGVL